MNIRPIGLWILAGLWLHATAGAVSSSWEPPPPTGDPELDAALAAFEQADWPAVIGYYSAVIERRPWDDEAHNRLGFAHRKLGDYNRALHHYGIALELNPHNRGALEYLGEAYLELDRRADAEALLERLADECRRIFATLDDCPEWLDLKAALDAAP